MGWMGKVVEGVVCHLVVWALAVPAEAWAQIQAVAAAAAAAVVLWRMGLEAYLDVRTGGLERS